MISNIEKGKKGERIALSYLRRRRYKLIAKNFRAIRCEIDIIMLDRKKDMLVFVEVKARTPGIFGTGAEAVDERKQRHLLLAAQCFMQRNQMYDINARFDVVEVDLKTKAVRHIENAFC